MLDGQQGQQLPEAAQVVERENEQRKEYKGQENEESQDGKWPMLLAKVVTSAS